MGKSWTLYPHGNRAHRPTRDFAYYYYFSNHFAHPAHGCAHRRERRRRDLDLEM